MSYTLHCGDAIEVMRTLPKNSVQTCVTSPPYFGLRDYQTATWDGGEPGCDHEPDKTSPSSTLEGGKSTQGSAKFYRDLCGKCGARRIDNQIGLEPTPEAYVAKLVDVFREVRRVLRDDGTLWLNLACSYNGSGGAGGDYGPGGLKEGQPKYPGRNLSNFKPKDMIPIPWMVAMALQQDGYYLRSDIIWHKPNPMPESVTDRPTKAHEYIFLLSKSATYYYDADAIREPQKGESLERLKRGWNGNGDRGYPNGPQNHLQKYMGKSEEEIAALPGRNKRSVWSVATRSYHGAHFAVFPPGLIEPCILAGSKPSDIVLDPFNGSGTTGAVSLKHGRQYIGIDLNPDYIKLAERRIQQAQPMLLAVP